MRDFVLILLFINYVGDTFVLGLLRDAARDKCEGRGGVWVASLCLKKEAALP